MSPKDHVIYGTIASAALYPSIGADAIYFWAASFLIDIDHYLDYIYHNNFTDFSFKRMFDYHNALDKFWHSPEFLSLEIFHTLEFLGALYLVSLWTASTVLLAVFFGFVFHSVLDIIYLSGHGVFSIRAYSFTEYYMRRKRLVKMGYSPGEIYAEAVRIVNGDGNKRF